MSTLRNETAPSELTISPAERRRALAGSAVGSAIEWYDFFLYGTMSALVFGPLFFTSNDATLSTMLALATFALSFLVRPIGGVLFSHLGDRIGRKKTLVFALSIMGIGTALICVLPTHAMVGAWAPILLIVLRLLQGLALGGEWGGGAAACRRVFAAQDPRPVGRSPANRSAARPGPREPRSNGQLGDLPRGLLLDNRLAHPVAADPSAQLA